MLDLGDFFVKRCWFSESQCHGIPSGIGETAESKAAELQKSWSEPCRRKANDTCEFVRQI